MRRPRALYAALLAMRVLLALSPSYIHPDEFFQAPEVAASDILGVDGVRTWEFTGTNPIRSIVSIYGYSGTPFILLRAMCAVLRLTGLMKMDAQPSTLAVFWAQRLFMAWVSLVVDWCVCRVIARRCPGARLLPTMLVLASSHCLAVFHTRPFGNAAASVLLALCFDLVSQIECALADAERQHVQLPPPLRLRQPFCLLAAVGVVGVFSHVTFAPFFLPLALVAATMVVFSACRGTVAVAHALATLALGTGCAALVALGLVLADSVYYGTVRYDSRAAFGVAGTLTCTVVNNLRYNSDAANLAAHGLHARYMHLAVSMPLLFGPLYLLAVAKLWTSVRRISRGFCSSTTTTGVRYLSSSSSSASPRGGGGSGCAAVDSTMLSACLSVVVGVLALSLARHQEPRFLLPALPGIVLFTWRWHRLLPAYFWQLWIVYNLAVAGIFGGVHQAGVVPVVKYLADTSVARELGCVPLNLPSGGDDVVCAHTTNGHTSSSNALDGSLALAFPRLKTNVLLYATYLAPRHLLVQNKQHRQLQARVAMTDLVSMDGSQVQAVLRSSVLVRCPADAAADAQRMVFARPSSSFSSPTQDTRRAAAEYERTLLVVPASTDLSSLLPANHSSLSSLFELRLLYSYAPHVNFDHIQTVLNAPFLATRLDVYLVCDG
ncbi:alpha 1,2 mannosyltransferase [Coemansia sp. RSA 1200]|nr:alpha 1,2 mannosyltransferase [Coemansia sp. RSA 1200]